MSKRIAMLVVALALVLGYFSFMPPKQAHAGAFNAPVLYVHGYNAGSAINCNSGSNFGTIRNYFSVRGYTNTATLGYYSGDYPNCDHYLPEEGYRCTNWFDSGINDETVNENIYHCRVCLRGTSGTTIPNTERPLRSLLTAWAAFLSGKRYLTRAMLLNFRRT